MLGTLCFPAVECCILISLFSVPTVCRPALTVVDVDDISLTARYSKHLSMGQYQSLSQKSGRKRNFSAEAETDGNPSRRHRSTDSMEQHNESGCYPETAEGEH